VADLGGLRGCKCPPLWQLVMYFCVRQKFSALTPIVAYVTHESIKWLCSSGITTTRHSYTLTYQFLTASAAPQSVTLTAASYTSTSQHSIGFINSFHFFFLFLSPKKIFQSTVQPHQSTARPLERDTNHIKVTRPPCLFRLPPVNRSTTLIHWCEWHHLINYSWEKLRNFVNVSYLSCFLP